MRRCCPVVELRQYRLHPGRRDALIALFDREFVETQEACGVTVIGQFRDLDDPDRFVWLRGFPDMAARTAALEAFYGGPVWAAHRDAANATMIDSDDVLLLRPAAPGTGFDLEGLTRDGGGGGVIVAAIRHLRSGEAPPPAPTGALAAFVTEPARNGYPRLPVREDANVFVTFGAVVTPGEEVEVRRLEPTARSLLRA
jgi:hypothetical protein